MSVVSKKSVSSFYIKPYSMMIASRRVVSRLTQVGRQSAALSSVESYTEKQAKKGRPVSPHVSIYKFPIVALSSITNRVTGVLLSIGVSGIGAMSFVGADPSAVTSTIAGFGAVAFVPKFLVAFPLVYHYLGGIRHMAWDRAPEQLTNDDVEKSSSILFGGAMALSTGLALITI